VPTPLRCCRSAHSRLRNRTLRDDSVGVWLPDVEHVHLRQLAMDFPQSKGFVTEDLLQPIERSLVGEAFNSGTPLVLNAMSEQVEHVDSSQACAEALESGCALPLTSHGRSLGVLTLASRIENSIRPEDVDFLTRVAGQIAIAVENALAYHQIAELKDKVAREKLYLEGELRGEMDYEGDR
jgi:formate hydrogenlyase transcriptional activator